MSCLWLIVISVWLTGCVAMLICSWCNIRRAERTLREIDGSGPATPPHDDRA
jgi:hypothetical protein